MPIEHRRLKGDRAKHKCDLGHEKRGLGWPHLIVELSDTRLRDYTWG